MTYTAQFQPNNKIYYVLYEREKREAGFDSPSLSLLSVATQIIICSVTRPNVCTYFYSIQLSKNVSNQLFILYKNLRKIQKWLQFHFSIELFAFSKLLKVILD